MQEYCVLIFVYFIVIIVEVMFGVLVVGCCNMDLFGVVVIVFFIVLGGGIVCDILLGNFLVIWIQYFGYIYMIFIGGLVIIVIVWFMWYLY